MAEFTIRYKSNKNIVYSCKYHVIWCPKYRRRVLIGAMETRLKEIIQNVCKELHSDLIELETMPDHVHMLVEVPIYDHKDKHGVEAHALNSKTKYVRLIKKELKGKPR